MTVDLTVRRLSGRAAGCSPSNRTNFTVMSDTSADVGTRTEEVQSFRSQLEELSLDSPESTNDQPLPTQSTPAALLALPDELLAEIFSYGSAGPDAYHEVSSIEPNSERAQAPFQRAAVSRQWRAAALSASPLWHYLLIPQTLIWSTDDAKSRIILEYAELVLERSRSFPIDIMFEFIESSAAAVAGLQPIFAAMRQSQSRWRRFLVRIRGQRAVNALLRCLEGPTPRLRTLQIVHQKTVQTWGFSAARNEYLWMDETEEEDSNETHVVPTILTDAPKLCWLTVVNLPDLPNHIALSPASELFSLEFISVSWKPCFWSLLGANKGVRRLMLGAIDELPESVEPIELPGLQRLWLLQGGSRILAKQPDLLQLPSLKTLSMVYGSFRGMERFLTGVRDVLTYLDLQLVEHLNKIDVDVLADLPHINQLRLAETLVPDTWLERLCRSSDPIMWPKLSWLGFKRCKIEELQNARLVEFARMRGGASDTQAHDRWVSVHMRLGRCHVPDEQIDQLKQLCTRLTLL